MPEPARLIEGRRSVMSVMNGRFEERGHQITYTREEVTARIPTPLELAGLGIPDGVPVIEVVHTGIDQDGRSFEVTKFVMRADYNGLDYTMPVED
jgi:GntR family transcriptional regulator